MTVFMKCVILFLLSPMWHQSFHQFGFIHDIKQPQLFFIGQFGVNDLVLLTENHDSFFLRAAFEIGKVIKDTFHYPHRVGLRIIRRAFATSFVSLPYILDDFVYIIMYSSVKIIALVNIHIFQQVQNAVLFHILVLLEDLLPARINIGIQETDQFRRKTIDINLNICQQFGEILVRCQFAKQGYIDLPLLQYCSIEDNDCLSIQGRV